MSDDLSGKLETFDEHAELAVQYLISWLKSQPDYLIAIARGRHCLGHYRFGDKLMYEFSPEQLEAETAEELADAIVYISRLLSLDSPPAGGEVAACKCEGRKDCDPPAPQGSATAC